MVDAGETAGGAIRAAEISTLRSASGAVYGMRSLASERIVGSLIIPSVGMWNVGLLLSKHGIVADKNPNCATLCAGSHKP